MLLSNDAYGFTDYRDEFLTLYFQNFVADYSFALVFRSGKCGFFTISFYHLPEWKVLQRPINFGQIWTTRYDNEMSGRRRKGCARARTTGCRPSFTSILFHCMRTMCRIVDRRCFLFKRDEDIGSGRSTTSSRVHRVSFRTCIAIRGKAKRN